jgi:hypothetical protein
LEIALDSKPSLDLRGIGQLQCRFSSRGADGGWECSPVVRTQERRSYRQSKLVLRPSCEQTTERQPRSRVLANPIDARVSESELNESHQNARSNRILPERLIGDDVRARTPAMLHRFSARKRVGEIRK